AWVLRAISCARLSFRKDRLLTANCDKRWGVPLSLATLCFLNRLRRKRWRHAISWPRRSPGEWKIGGAFSEVRFLLDKKEDDFQEALRIASGLTIDVLASDDTVVPGQEFNLTISVTNGGPYNFPELRAVTDLPPGWEAVYDNSTGSLEPGQRLDQKYKVKVSN